MYRLENKSLAAEFDGQGRLTYLSGTERNVIASPAEASFRMVFRKDGNWENVIYGSGQDFAVTQSQNALRFPAPVLCCWNGTSVNISLTLVACLEEDSLRFRAEICNQEEGALVTDFEYPYVGMVKSLDGGTPALLFPGQCGSRITNIGEYLARRESREQQSCAYSESYPGTASMQWMALEERGAVLFLASYDADHYATILTARGSAAPEKRGAVTLLFDKLAFVQTGERWVCPEASLMLYAGTWHRGADAYAAWTKTWRTVHPVPDWIRNMTGYYLVIMKQQFGTEMWDYASIPQLYALARENGCDTVGLFGWYASGHDNQYPDLEASESMGGAEALRRGIRQVQQEGGHVTLYYQGHLIDVSTQFYRQRGSRLIVRSKDGIPYYEQYNKAHNSTYLRLFTRKTFATACPSCPEWQELMKEKADWLASFGPDGVLYDQIGGLPPRPCFDESHPHLKGKPSLAISGGRKTLLDGIQRRTKEINPNLAFFVENITDVYSAYVDALHGIASYPGKEAERLEDNGEPAFQNYPELFRYCFPDRVITLRNQRPWISKRAANYAAAYGFCYELEVRYDADKQDVLADRYHEEALYARKAVELRKRHWDLVGTGRFVDSRYLEQHNPAIISKAFEADGRLAVVLWNDTGTGQPLALGVPGWIREDVDTVDGHLDELPDVMAPQQLLICTYRKETGV